MIELYPAHHEMDVIHFINLTDEISEQSHKDTKLKQLRKRRGLSQTELAEHLRSVQMYEQFVNDIDKAQARTLFSLLRVLGCILRIYWKIQLLKTNLLFRCQGEADIDSLKNFRCFN